MLSTETDNRKWLALLLIALAVVLSLMTWFSATAVLPDLTAQLQLTPSQAAWMTNAVQLGFAVGALTSSVLALADSWPLTRFIAASALTAALANALLLLDTGAGGAVTARFLTGVALAGIYPPAMKLIATWFQTGRGLALGIMVGALTLGSALPHLVRALGGQLPWHLVIAACSISSVLAALIFLLLVREGPYAFARTHVDLRHLGAVLRNRSVLLANAGYFGHMWELYAVWGWFLAYVGNSQHETGSLLNVSLLTFAVIAMGAPGCIAGGWLADRWGRCYTTVMMLGISGACALMIGFVYSGPQWLFVVIALIWGFAVVADSAQFSTAVTELSDPALVGSSLAFQMGVGFSITMVSIWLTPLIAEWLGSWQWAFLLLVPGPLLGIFAMLKLRNEDAAVKMANGLR